MMWLLFVIALLFYPVQVSRAADEKDYFEAGIQFMNEGEVENAIDSLRKAIRINPGIPQFHNALGVALLRRDQSFESAMNAFQKAIEIDPTYAEPYFNIGTHYAGIENDLILATEYFERTIEADPTFSKGFLALGWASLQKKEPREASQFFEKALELVPSYPEAQYGLALAYVSSDRKAEALKPITTLRTMGRSDLARKIEQTMQNEEEETQESFNLF